MKTRNQGLVLIFLCMCVSDLSAEDTSSTWPIIFRSWQTDSHETLSPLWGLEKEFDFSPGGIPAEVVPGGDPLSKPRVLPPLPGSASLFFYALGSLGALYAGRTVRRAAWDFGSEWDLIGKISWYGDTLIRESGLTSGPLSVCTPETSLSGNHKWYLHGRVPGPRWDLKYFRICKAPRSPPSGCPQGGCNRLA
jgi:hypothetical protein